MTVCIAAVCRDDKDRERIALVADWMRTDSNTNRGSDTAFKLAWLGRATVMGSGDLDVFDHLIHQANRKLRVIKHSELTIEDCKNAYLWAEAVYRKEYLQRHVLFRFEAIYDSLGQQEEDETEDQYIARRSDFMRVAEDRTHSIEVPFTADAIIAGFDGNNASLWRILSGDAVECSRKGFAVIGEGYSVAEVEMQKCPGVKFLTEGESLFLCYLAKTRSEVIRSVGSQTGLYIWRPDGGGAVASGIKKKFAQELKAFENRQQKAENRMYERAKKIYEEAGAISGEVGT